jgi:tetratricopeptide (TPR) repeat protein
VEPGQAAPSADELVKRLDANPELKGKERSVELATSVGRLYYANGRYSDAATFFRQALTKAGPVRALYAERLKPVKGVVLPKPEDAGCGAGADGTVDKLMRAAKAKAAAKEPLAAAACAKAALRVVLETESLLADSLFMLDDRAGALAEYTRVLQGDKDLANALYGHAGLLLEEKPDDVSSLKSARAELAHYLELSPEAPRAANAHKLLAHADEAIAAGGMTALNKARKARPAPALAQAPMMSAPAAGTGAPPMADAPPALTPQMMQAVQNTEMTPEVVAGLSKLVEQGEESLAHGQFQEALDAD